MSAKDARLGLKDGLRVASVGLRARPLRAALSALGIAIGTAAIVAVLGLSSSSQAGLLAEIDRLGTNMLTVEAGQSFTGGAAQLPLEAPARITLLDNVQGVAHTALLKNERVYRNSMIPVANTRGIEVRATSLNLLLVLGTGVARGDWLNEGTASEPVAVLGSGAARQLGIDRVLPDERIWLGGQWFSIAGILNPSPLAPDVDASALVGYPAAQKYLGYVSLVGGEVKAGPPSTIYVRAATGHEAEVQSLLAQTANPEAPYEVNVSQPSDVLVARAAAAGAFDSLFLGLGVVALFMLAYYRLAGLLAVLALIVYTTITLSLYKLSVLLPGYTIVLTLAGIAGFILSIGMAVDANILIFERMKEELRAGKSYVAAVEAAFDRAWTSIRDSNVSTLITCAILFMTSGATPIIRGFAVTLGLGVLVSLFTAIVITRTLLRLTIRQSWGRHARWYGLKLPEENQ